MNMFDIAQIIASSIEEESAQIKEPIEVNFNVMNELKELEKINGEKVLAKKEFYKQMGSLLVKNNLKDEWVNYIDREINSKLSFGDIWYNGMKVEAVLKCMESLSKGYSIEDTYAIINVQAGTEETFNGGRITGFLNYLVAKDVAKFHEKGLEFLGYRDEYIKENINKGRC